MASSAQNDPGGGLPVTDQALIHAGMMEELGFARLDTLPLENKKGSNRNLDTEASNRSRTPAQIPAEHAAAHAAWRNVSFDDVDPAALGLDSMNNGQSHRLRLRAELRSSHSFHGERPARGHRGETPRGAGQMSAGRGRGGAHHGAPPRSSHIAVKDVLARLRSRPVHRRGTQGRAYTRGANVTSAHHTVATPRATLSFNDVRSVTALPVQGVVDRGTSGVERPARQLRQNNRHGGNSRYNVMATPEEFLASSWPNQIRDTRHDEAVALASDRASPSMAPESTVSAEQFEDSIDRSTPSVPSHTAPFQQSRRNDVASSSQVALPTVTAPPSLKSNDEEIKNHKDHKLSSKADSGHVGKLINFSDEEPESEVHSRFTADLLSLLDDHVVDQTLDEINNAPAGSLLEQVSTLLAVSDAESTNAVVFKELEQKVTDTGIHSTKLRGGLSTSTYATPAFAAQAVVGRVLNRSSTFRGLPTEISSKYKSELAKRVWDKATEINKDEQTGSKPTAEPTRHYSMEAILTHRHRPSPIGDSPEIVRFNKMVQNLRSPKGGVVNAKETEPPAASTTQQTKPIGLAGSVYASGTSSSSVTTQPATSSAAQALSRQNSCFAYAKNVWTVSALDEKPEEVDSDVPPNVIMSVRVEMTDTTTRDIARPSVLSLGGGLGGDRTTGPQTLLQLTAGNEELISLSPASESTLLAGTITFPQAMADSIFARASYPADMSELMENPTVFQAGRESHLATGPSMPIRSQTTTSLQIGAALYNDLDQLISPDLEAESKFHLPSDVKGSLACRPVDILMSKTSSVKEPSSKTKDQLSRPKIVQGLMSSRYATSNEDNSSGALKGGLSQPFATPSSGVDENRPGQVSISMVPRAVRPSSIKPRQGLSSSRFADPKDNDRVQGHSKVRPEVPAVVLPDGPDSGHLGRHSPLEDPLTIRKTLLGRSRRSLTPTAEPFTPSRDSVHSPQRGHHVPSTTTPFPTPVRSTMATVFVTDPLTLSGYREIGKIGNSPIMVHMSANGPQASPLRLYGSVVQPLLLPDQAVEPLSPKLTNSNASTNKQFEVQLRLQKSLARRRDSGDLLG